MRRFRWVAGLLFSVLLSLAAPVPLSYAAGPPSYAAGSSSYAVRSSSYAVGSSSYAVGSSSYVAGSSSYLAEVHAYVAEPSPHGSLAGSRAGVGRTPPGRELPAPDTTGVAVPPPAPTEPPPAVSQEPRPERPTPARQAVGGPGARPLVNVLPLGAGLLLTGLGLGFLALRLRR
ncbi:hypothetical protein [Streptomyces sp. NPDC102360]|uniref:hypothetical protein n=1 Tax=Streptomyces sp. NPDC102360 TaxID=3366160 RepID=UPI0038120531